MSIANPTTVSGSVGAGNTSITSPSISVTSGGLICVQIVAENSNTVNFSTMSDTAAGGSNTYSGASNNPVRLAATTNRNCWTHYATAKATESITVTWQCDTSVSITIVVNHTTSTLGSLLIDNVSGTSGSSSVPDPGTSALSGSSDIIFESSDVSGSDTTGTGFTRLANVSGNEFQYKKVAGSWGASAFTNSQTTWVAQGIAFKEPSSGFDATTTVAAIAAQAAADMIGRQYV